MDTNNEILDAIEILAGKKISENITKVLTGICKSVNINNNTCVMDSNGVSSTVQFYGSPPDVNELYRIFVPSNDMSRSFIIVPPKFTVNPNLLDNWYFEKPVNQRGGKIIQSGVNIYTDSALKTLIGPAAYACPVVELTSAYAKVQDAKNTSSYYYAAPGDVVRGYVPAWNGYSIDRWAVESDSEVVITFVNGGIHVKNTSTNGRQFKQILPNDLNLAGRMVTISALVGDVIGSVNYVLTQTSNPYKNSAACTITTNGLFSASGSVLTGQQKIVFGLEPGAEITILAVKLELGPTQTLAHQDAAGNWMLNEVPEYGGQLRRCQRYYYQAHYTQYQTINMAYEDTAYAFIMLPLPVGMRLKNPVLTQSTPIILGSSEKTLADAEVSGCMARLGINYSAISNAVRSCYSYCPSVEGVTFTLSADL